MIKKLLGLLVLFSIGSCVFASHLVGGSLGYEYIGKVGVNYRYKILLTVYNNCDASSQIPLPIASQDVSIYLQDIPNNPMGGGNKTFFQTLTLNLVDSNEVIPPTSSGCAVGATVCIYKGVYEAFVDLPLNFNGYHLYFENFARNAAITNLLNPGGTAMAFHAYIAPSLVNNSTPVFLDDPVPFLCVNDTVSILNTAIDPDGDQLIFSFVTPMAGNGGSPSPLPWAITPVLYNGGYSTAQPFGVGGYSFINGGNGLTQYMAPALGNYVVAVEIREWRAGKLIGVSRRDLQLLVINCPPNPAPNLSATGGSGTTQYSIAECTNLNFPITFTDANGDSLTLSSAGQIFDPSFVNPPATIDSLVLGDSTVTASFNWQPSCGTAQALPYIFNVSATDNGCPPKTTNVIYEITILPHTPPTSINGLYLVCANTTTTYTTNVVPSSTYNWTVTGGVINSGQGTTSISVTWGSAGTGTVFVNSVSTCGCPSAIIDTNVTILAAPVANAGIDTTICLGDTVQIGGSPTGPPGATYTWLPATNINNTTIANPLVWPTITTNYFVNVDNGVCASKDTVTIVVGSISINAGNDTTICLGSSVQLNATGGIIYNWTPTTGLSNPNISNPIATPLTTTTYLVTVTDALGCSGTDTVKITVTNPPTITLNNDTTVCLGTCVQLTAGGGTTYQWSPTTGLSNPNIANPVACPLVTTTYLVTVTNAVNCVSVDSVKITINPSPVIQSNNDTAVCIGNCVQLNTTGGISYSWSPITALSNSAIGNPIACPIITTNYVVTGTDATGCTAKDTVVITINPLPVVSAGSDKSVCINGSVVIGGSPSGPAGSTFSWTPAATLNNGAIANPTATPIVTTTYVLTVVNVNGCTKKDSVIVTVNPLPIVNAGNDTSICTGTSVTIGGSPTTPSVSPTYSWTPATTLNNPSIANPVATPTSSPTSYIVTVTDANLCVKKDTVIVSLNPSPVIKSNNDTAVCIGNCVQLNTTGGISYSWSPITALSNSAIGNPIACPIITTNYVVTGTDLNGCTAKDTVVITINPLPIITAFSDTAICIGASAQLNASGGTSYLWTPSLGLSDTTIANPIAMPIVTTTYIVNALDGNSCSNADTITVTVNNLPVINAGSDVVICFGDTTQLLATGGNSYVWSPVTGLSNSTIANPLAFPTVTTSYIVNGTDINLCVNMDTVVVTVNPLPVINAGADTSFCFGGSVQLAATGGTSYLWTPSLGLSDTTIANPVANPIISTVYIVVGTDGNSCANADTVLVTVNPLPIIDAGSDLWLCIGDNVQLNATGGITYLWTPSLGLSDTTIANPIANPLTSTTYIVTGFDNNGCSDNDSMILTVNDIVPINIGNDTIICVGDSVQLGGNPTSPVGTTFSWTPTTSLDNPTLSNPIAFPTVTTTYYLTATNDTCSSIDSVTVVVHPLTLANAGIDVAICIGDTAQLSASGGVSYLWQPTNLVSDSLIFNPLAFPTVTTDFVVNVTDNNGCNASDTVVVTVNPFPVINAGADTSFCIGGSVQLTASGGTSYLWAPSLGLSDTTIANPIANPIVSTVYTVVGTDGNSCSNADTVLVTVNPLPIITAFSDTAICIGASAQLNTTGGTSYVWTPSATLSNPNIANPVATPIVTTTYIVNALDGNSCANADTITVTVNNLPVINAGSDVAICFGDTTQLLATGGNSYVWSPITGLSSSTIANPLAFPTATTSYFVNGTDTNLCVNNDTVVVTVNPLPTINAGTDTSFCIGGSVQLIAIGGTSYLWTPSLGLSDTTIANPIANPNNTTNYIVVSTDGNSCANTDTVLVTVNPLPIITAFSDTSICIGASAQLNAIGGTSYLWTPSLGLSDTTIANPIATPIVTTTYIVNALDGNSCANADTITVTVNNLPIINAGSDVAICFGDTILLLASGGNSYVWSPITGLSSSTIANPLAFPTTTTSYIVNGTDTNFCVNNDTVVVTVNPLPLINAGADTSFCIGGSVQLTATGGTGYVWSPATGLSSTTIANPIANPIISTVYIVVGTDGNSCANTDSILVTVHPLPVVNVGADTAICIGASAQLNATGGTSYLWAPSLGLSDTTIANPVATPIVTTTYIVNALDGNSCANADTITVTVNGLPTINAGSDVAICFGDTTQLLATGGNSYVWSPATGLSSSTVANPLAFPTVTTSYIVNGTDINLCVNNDTVVVTVNQLPTINAGTDNSFCIGGSLQLTATGGTSYLWSPSLGLSDTTIANPVANPLVTTTYFVIGTDGNSCSNADTVLVTVHPLPVINAGADTAICIGASAQLNATGGTSYVWTPSATLSNPNIANPVATPIVTTTYIVNALDGNSCANADTITVTVNGLPTINAGSDVAICFGDTTQLLASGGSSYVWSPVTGLSSSIIANPLAFPANTTSYIVNGTDTNLCVNNDTVVVTVNQLPTISIGISDTVYLCLGDSTQLIASGGVSYQWTPNTFISNSSVFNPFVYPPTTTTYTVIGTDANSCKNSDSIVVAVFSIPSLTDTTICIGDSIQLNVSGPTNATYTWSPITNLSNPNIANPYTNTTTTITYTVIVQNASGCTDTTSVTVVAVDKPTADFTIESLLSCDGILVNFNNQSVLANNYVWNFGDGQQSTLVNPSHVFNYATSVTTILTAISINGCIDTYSLPIINGNFEDLFNITPASIFTPNRDGYNDLFRLDLPKDMGTCTNVQIFNRWGMLVFEAINQNIGWDGRTTTGEEVPAGTYFYIVEVNGIVKKGALTLFR